MKKATKKIPPVTRETLEEVLNAIPDPELQIGIMDLGLIYDIHHEGKKAVIKMTLTTLGCPIGPMITQQIEEKLKELGIEDVLVELVWDPPWSIEKMKPEIRQMMFGG